MIIDLFSDFNIDIAPEGHKHHRAGWVNIECPFCTGAHGYHLGFNLDNKYFFCFRCGYHPFIPALSKLLNVNYDQAKDLARSYKINKYKTVKPERKDLIKTRSKIKYPSDLGPIQKQHIKYLKRRGFDPYYLEEHYGIQGTGPVSKLKYKDKDRNTKVIDLKHRLFIPIYWYGKLVSFQTRDITNKASIKYITCPEVVELIHHKHILYGKQEYWGELGICVEGVTDVWNMGFLSFATFGAQYTMEQVKVMAKNFKYVAVVSDPDMQRKRISRKLIKELEAFGVFAWREKIRTDPGSMSSEEVNNLLIKIKQNYGKAKKDNV